MLNLSVPKAIASHQIVERIVAAANAGLGRRDRMTTDEAMQSWGLVADHIILLDGEWEMLPRGFMPLYEKEAGVYVYGDYLHIVCRGVHDSEAEAFSFLFSRFG